MTGGLRDRLRTEGLRALGSGQGLPEREPLPRWVAPVPEWLENVGLRLATLVALVNLAGTAFGFWYYRWQFSVEPLAMWPLVPDSPVATLFIALAFLAWRVGRPSAYLSALAFFGCWKLGLWTPFVLLYFHEGFTAVNPWPLYLFLVFSHLAMVLEGFVLHRVTDFPVRAVALAVAWYGLNDVVDYFLPVVGTPHHTWVVGQAVQDGWLTHPTAVHAPAAAAAVTLTLTATFLALATRVKILERRRSAGDA